MKYIFTKLLSLFLTLLLISIITFFSFEILAGNRATLIFGVDSSQQKQELIEESLGLNEPVWVRYLSWMGGFITGDMGVSYTYSIPVSDVIYDKLGVTLTLFVYAFVLIILIGIPLGIIAAMERGKVTGGVVYILSQIGMSIPPFFLGIIMISVLGMTLRLFTPGAYVPIDESVTGFLKYMICPAIAIAIPQIAMIIKFMRESVLNVLSQDYIKTAYSKGCSKRRVMFKHILKNSIIPVITFLGFAIMDTIAGSIIIEQVFSLPGVGRLLITSIANRDIPIVQAIVMYISIIVVLINFAIDLCYEKIDSRIRIR